MRSGRKLAGSRHLHFNRRAKTGFAGGPHNSDPAKRRHGGIQIQMPIQTQIQIQMLIQTQIQMQIQMQVQIQRAYNCGPLKWIRCYSLLFMNIFFWLELELFNTSQLVSFPVALDKKQYISFRRLS